jgi:murein L,D-transpeptidase YcbB/YkuD
MAFGNATLSDISGGVSDIFGGIAANTQAGLRAKGLNLNAEGLRMRARGDLAEASNYGLASTLADQNAQFTQTSTAIKLAQQDRQAYQALGATQADVAASGFENSGSSLDLMRDSASQASLTRAVMGQQGLITEAGYKEQAQSYTTMQQASTAAATDEMTMATETDQLANETRDAGKQAGIFSDISGVLKGAAAIATLFV